MRRRRERRVVGDERLARFHGLGVVGHAVDQLAFVFHEAARVVGNADGRRQAVVAAEDDFVAVVEKYLVCRRRAPAHDQIHGGGGAEQLGKLQRERGIAVARRRNLVCRGSAHIRPDETPGAHRNSVVLVVAAVLLGEIAEADSPGKIHPQLAAHEAAVEDVLGVFVRFEHGAHKVLAFVEVLGHAPLLEAHYHHLRLFRARITVLHYVYAAAMPAGIVLARKRIGDAPYVYEVDRAEHARQIEDERLRAAVAKRQQFGILRARRLVVYLVEYKLAVVDSRAGQPLYLAVELRRDSAYELAFVGGGVVGLARDRLAHRVAPIVVAGGFVAQFRRY